MNNRQFSYGILDDTNTFEYRTKGCELKPHCCYFNGIFFHNVSYEQLVDKI